MWNKPLIPQHDANKDARQDDIQEGQKDYRYKYTYQALEGVTMVEGIPSLELPKLPWIIKLVSIGVKLAKNMAKNKHADEKTRLLQDEDTLTKDFQNVKHFLGNSEERYKRGKPYTFLIQRLLLLTYLSLSLI
ncbi:MAG: hypothetical protein Q9M36_09655 [Sulfurovum sp.]|nr:hypothetical protein [Sulfurovum sp.]